MSSLVRGHRWDLDRRCCCGSAPTSQAATRGAGRRPAAQARSLPGLDPRDTAGQPWQPGRRKRWPGADTLSNNCLKIGLPLTRKCVPEEAGGAAQPAGAGTPLGRAPRSCPAPRLRALRGLKRLGVEPGRQDPELSERVSLRPPGQSKAPVAPETVRPSAAAPWAGSPAPGLSFPFCSVRVSLSPRLGCTHPGTECRAHSGLPGAKAEEGNAAPTAVSQPTSEGPGALGSSV